MPRHVALIRGINLGPNKRVPMAELREALGAAGYEDVRTLLASGNVVLSGAGKRPADVERDVAQCIAERFGHDVGVMARTEKELLAVARRHPFADREDDPSRLHVAFLSGEPRELPGDDFEPERFVLSGREIFIWLPGGMQNSLLMRALSERDLGVAATVRNWNTVTKIAGLLAG